MAFIRAFLFVSAILVAQSAVLAPPPLYSISLPPGFSIALYTNISLPSARQLAISRSPAGYPQGNIVYVGSSGTNVYALVDRDGTGRNVTATTVLSGLFTPNGVAYVNGSLYVAQTPNITRFDNVDAYALAGQPFGPGTLVSAAFNGGQNDHALHYLKYHELDGYLYANQGSPSNTGPCNVYGEITECSIVRLLPDGSNISTYTYGVRNSVGFDWDPRTGDLWATTNARDNIATLGANGGDTYQNSPDDFLMYIPVEGQDYGFPYCHFTGVGDPTDRDIDIVVPTIDDTNVPPGVTLSANNASFLAYCNNTANAEKPAQALGPHVASLGMTFYDGNMFPEEYNHTIFNAQHGSWDRPSAPIGYRVMSIGADMDGLVNSYSPFAVGWLNATLAPPNENAWGRPVDVMQMPDGALLISDDQYGAVYRVSYTAPATPAFPTATAGK